MNMQTGAKQQGSKIMERAAKNRNTILKERCDQLRKRSMLRDEAKMRKNAGQCILQGIETEWCVQEVPHPSMQVLSGP